MSTRTLTQEKLRAEARARFGEDPRRWAFTCPHCGDVACARDFLAAGADPNRVGQDCIGRHLGALDKAATGTDGRAYASRGCDWVAYGIFRGPWFIAVPDGKGGVREVPSFPLAPAPQVWEQRLVDILAELAQGKTMEAAADHLRLSLGQTKQYLRRALRRFKVRNRTALINIACLEGALPLRQPRATEPRKDLGPQETRVLYRLAEGDSYTEIGKFLHLARDTVGTYVKRALYARGATTAAQLVYLSHQDGLLGSTAPGAATEDADE
jgi:DNA-binding NarL/FixJ family response regulator